MANQASRDDQDRPDTSRRSFLGATLGAGSLALADALGGSLFSPSFGSALATSVDKGILKSGHFPARAKRVVFIHMCGAVSQVDTFDYKPTLIKRHG